jgi:hypothetical protein
VYPIGFTYARHARPASALTRSAILPSHHPILSGNQPTPSSRHAFPARARLSGVCPATHSTAQRTFRVLLFRFLLKLSRSEDLSRLNTGTPRYSKLVMAAKSCATGPQGKLRGETEGHLPRAVMSCNPPTRHGRSGKPRAQQLETRNSNQNPAIGHRIGSKYPILHAELDQLEQEQCCRQRKR